MTWSSYFPETRIKSSHLKPWVRDSTTQFIDSSHYNTVGYVQHICVQALVVGVATLPLRYVIESKTLSISDDIDVVRRSPGKNIAASLKASLFLAWTFVLRFLLTVEGFAQVSVELAADTKDLPTQMSPVKKPSAVDAPTSYTVTKILPADERTNWTSSNKCVALY